LFPKEAADRAPSYFEGKGYKKLADPGRKVCGSPRPKKWKYRKGPEKEKEGENDRLIMKSTVPRFGGNFAGRSTGGDSEFPSKGGQSECGAANKGKGTLVLTACQWGEGDEKENSRAPPAWGLTTTKETLILVPPRQEREEMD